MELLLQSTNVQKPACSHCLKPSHVGLLGQPSHTSGGGQHVFAHLRVASTSRDWLAGLLPTSIGVLPAFLGILATLHHEGVGLYQGVGVILLPSLCTSAPAARNGSLLKGNGHAAFRSVRVLHDFDRKCKATTGNQQTPPTMEI